MNSHSYRYPDGPEPRRSRFPWPIAAAAALLLGTGLYWARYRLQSPASPPTAGSRAFPRGIVIHHTATGPTFAGNRVDAALIDQWHARRGFSCRGPDGRTYHIGYHFLILPDGSIERGRPETALGAHARRHNDTLGICLVGSFDRRDNPWGDKGPLVPSDRQMTSLKALLAALMFRYQLGPADVALHREVVATTACPGDRFPARDLRAALAPGPRTWSVSQSVGPARGN
jgi:N-acetylmuramoyl-L-alanine amidase